MASKQRSSARLELREPEIPLPQPLRIVKQRGQTIAGSSASGEIKHGGRGISSCSEESRGSPPITVDRPLTVHKRRGGRGSVLNGSFDDPPSPRASGGSAISDLIKRNAERTVLEDINVTPKAVKQVLRTASAGTFLKSEFHYPRDSRDSDTSSNGIHMSQLNEEGERISPPKIPERRLSKSKNFFFKLGSRKDREPKPIQRINSSTSKNTLIRRLSCGANQNSGSESKYTDSITSADSSYLLNSMKSKDIADIIIDSEISCYDRSSSHSLSSESMENWGTREELFLCPEITITPEISSLDSGSTNLWVAVEVTGALRLASGYGHDLAKLCESRRTVSGHSAAHLRNFGRLHSMRIDLVTTRDSSVLEVVGNLHESKIVYAGETHLILAKLRIAKVNKVSSHIRESSTSEEIMADLENHLGGAVTSYLTVRLTYKHSGFLQYKRTTIDWEGGISAHMTRLQTEASAFIKRHNIQSVWSPRTSREINGPLDVNPLIKLVEMHLPADKARDAIRRLADDRVPIPMARRLLNGSDAADRSSEDTIRVSVGSNIATRIDSAVSMAVLQPQARNVALKDSEAQSMLAPPDVFVSKAINPTTEIDPARKIWTEMRRNSRGYRHYRTSISDGHYSNDSDDCSPSRLSSADTVDEERKKIRDIALRNKRSVGADTLKSFAPSVGKAKGGTIGGLGLGVGRSWWVGSNWW